MGSSRFLAVGCCLDSGWCLMVRSIGASVGGKCWRTCLVVLFPWPLTMQCGCASCVVPGKTGHRHVPFCVHCSVVDPLSPVPTPDRRWPPGSVQHRLRGQARGLDLWCLQHLDFRRRYCEWCCGPTGDCLMPYHCPDSQVLGTGS